MEYTIYINGRQVGHARDLEQAVRIGRLYRYFGNVLIETPSGNISTLSELEAFIEKEALFLARW